MNVENENKSKEFLLLSDLLEQIGWAPKLTNNSGVLLVDFEEDGTPIQDAIFSVSSKFERFICYFNFRDAPSKILQNQLVEFITRANFNLVFGNFEYDYESGRIRFKSSIDFSNVDLTEILMRNAIQSTMDVVEQYADLLLEVLRGNMTALQAILEAEKAFHEDE